MKINKDSWHYRIWASTFDSYLDVPSSTDLCRYCHRVFWQLFMWLVFVLGMLYCAVALLYVVFYMGLAQHTLFTVIVFAVAGILVGAGTLYYRWINGSKRMSEPTTLPGKYLAATKQKVCPLVEFDKE